MPRYTGVGNNKLEGKPAWQLTDKELITIIRGRGNELEIAQSFKPLVHILEQTIRQRPNLADGLNVAIAMTKLHSQRFAPGHSEHPYKDFSLQDRHTVSQVVTPGERRPPAMPTNTREASVPQSKPKLLDIDLPDNIGYGKVGQVIEVILRLPQREHENIRTLIQSITPHLRRDISQGDIYNAIRRIRQLGLITDRCLEGGGIYLPPLKQVNEPSSSML